MENRTIELIKVHNSNTCISIRDTGINNLTYELLYFKIGMLKKDKISLKLDNNSLITNQLFLDGNLLDINSYTLGITQINEELLELELGVIQIDYHQFNKIGTFTVSNNSITINQNILNTLDYSSIVYINGDVYTINKNKSYNNIIVLNETIIDGIFNIYIGFCDTKYVVNNYSISKELCNILRDNISDIDNLKCNNKKISKEDLVTLILETKSLDILKENCDILKIASLIESIKNKMNIENETTCSC